MPTRIRLPPGSAFMGLFVLIGLGVVALGVVSIWSECNVPDGVQKRSWQARAFGVYFTLTALGMLSCTVDPPPSERHYAVVFVLIIGGFYLVLWLAG